MIELSYMFGGKTCSISRDSIVATLQRYDANTTSSTTRKGRKYFVWWKDQPYPPKEILRNVKGGPKKVAFSGGRATNQVFVDLEFYVGKHKFPKRIEGTNSATPSLLAFKRKLLAQHWKKLRHNFLPGQDGKYPGVYLLALSRRDLANKAVRLNDIFYVGSSCTGLNARLNQFVKGIGQNCCHSAAMRFYRRWRRRTAKHHHFYVAVWTIPAETRKEMRSDQDLLKMGRVAELEYAMLAHIKKRTGFEPLLNRK